MKTILLFLAIVVANSGIAQVFSEDFEGTGGVMPAGWTLINNDGLTPDPNVVQFTDAWIVSADFDNPTDTVAMSTSWYSPPGTADDWMATPQISLTSNNVLSWEDEAQDANFPDGYEVRISTTTPTIAGFNANPALFTSAAASPAVWAMRTVDLAAAGYQNQNVYLAWHNNSTDMFVLMIDDISIDVASVPTYDVSMSDTTGQQLEYTIVPLSQVNPLGTSGEITEVGGLAVTGATMSVTVYDGAMAPVYTASSTGAPIGVGGSITATVAGYTPLVEDLYTIEMIASITETDANIINDTVTYSILVSDSVYARDDSQVAGTVGIGAGTSGSVGQRFTVNNTDDITSVSMFISNANYTMAGQPLSATVYATDVTGMPTTPLVSTTTITLDTTTNMLWTIPIAGGAFNLTAGDYVVVANEGDSNITIGLSNNIFTLNSTWVTFTGSNPVWAPNEVYGINQTYVLRANFGPVTSCAATAATVTDDACETYTWAQNGQTYTISGQYNDTIPNACGADSVITLDLTINTPDAVTETVSECDSYVWSADGQTYSMTGTYTATLTNVNGCDSIVTLDLTIGALDNTTTTVAATITANQAGATYQWIDCGNGDAAITGETNQAFTATANGDYAVIITSGACVDTSACVTIGGIGLKENVISNNIEIFPNPSNGEFTIELTELSTNALTIKFIDANGRIISQESFNNVSGNLTVPMNIAGLDAGIYFVKITSADGQLTERVIITKE